MTRGVRGGSSMKGPRVDYVCSASCTTHSSFFFFFKENYKVTHHPTSRTRTEPCPDVGSDAAVALREK